MHAITIVIAASFGTSLGYMFVTDDPKVPSHLRNCSYYLEGPRAYTKMLKSKPHLQQDLRVLDSEHDLRCCPKPDGAVAMLGTVDIERALALLDEVPESAWLEEDWRQRKFEVHRQTESILFLWKAHLDSTPVELPRWAEWKKLMEPVMDLICNFYGYKRDEVDLWKAMITRLPPGRSILKHRDMNPALIFPHRVHWVITSEQVVTNIGTEVFSFTPGTVFEFNNVLLHSVTNNGEAQRAHIILDVVPRKMAGFEPKKQTSMNAESNPEL